MKAARWRGCELCGGAAAVHCEADAAFLCWACDARVHGANFLVARHLRRVAGAGSPPVRSLCSACGPAGSGFSDESESVSCVSTAESTAIASAGRRGQASAEGVLARRGGRAGLGRRRVAEAVPASVGRLRRACRGTAETRSRVSLEAALWLAARRRGWRGSGTREAASGVPVELIVRASTRLARAALRANRAMAMEEGWAECY
ncbi:hypothetical protein GW17_00043299 [Ensete ventricosum]|nr:hypothetical protein GW17_00043299 [Ensete ventricosum]